MAYQRCPQCLVGIGWDVSDAQYEKIGHICSPGNPYIAKQARQSGVEPIAYVAGICGVSEQEVVEFWETHSKEEVMDSWDSRWEY